MATLTTVSQFELDEQRIRIDTAGRPALGAVVAAGLALLAVLVHGYHPYADDGGLYVAGVKHLLNPALYPHNTSFVLEPTRLSIFAQTTAAIERLSQLGLPGTLLALHYITVWATLFAAWLVSARCWPLSVARLGAVTLLACWLSLPVAGTALVVMDPYLTARSFSTALGMLAIAGALDIANQETRRRGVLVSAGSLAFAVLVHPLMGSYVAFAVLLITTVQARSTAGRRWAALCVSAGLLAAAFAAHLLAPPESGAAAAAALTRTYWFPAQWAWYELIGLLAPLVLLAGYARLRRGTPAADIAHAALLLGLTAVTVASLFARADARSHLVARLQPLRAFHTVYLLMLLVLGAELGQRVLKASRIRWGVTIIVLCAPMYFAQRDTYRHSPHIELRETSSPNLWVQGFLWARHHTPTDALFALDSDYINASGEDAQTFRAIAERSSLPDFSKDGGEASIAPDLAPAWLAGSTSQEFLDDLHGMAPEQADRARRAALARTGADWLILRASSPTALRCPYANAAVKVCRLAPAD